MEDNTKELDLSSLSGELTIADLEMAEKLQGWMDSLKGKMDNL